MDNKQEYKLFNPAGCLSEQGLKLYGSGMLTEADTTLVEKHLESCEMCSMAVEGYALSDPAHFTADVELLNQSFGEILQSVPGNSKLNPVAETADFEGPRFPRLSQEEMREFRESILARASAQETIQETEKLTKRKPVVPFWHRHRIELIAAGLLVLISFGGWQLFIYLNQSGNNKNIAAVNETYQNIQELKENTQTKENVVEETTQSESAEHVKAKKPKPATTAVSGKPQSIIKPVENIEVINDDAEASGLIDVANQDVTNNSVAPLVVEETMSYPEKKEISTLENVVAGKSKKASRVKSTSDEAEADEQEIFTVVEESPQYPGGEEARVKFLQDNLRYPDKAREAGIQGTVYISFVVETDGAITDIRVLRGIGSGCDEEAVRAIKKMPRWIAGKQRGKPVRVQFNMPIVFTLAG